METLIFILVLIVIIVSNIVRIQKKQKDAAAQRDQHETPEETRQTGWKKNFRDMFAEMQGDTLQKQGSAPRQGRSAGWEDLLSSKDSAGKEPEKAADHDKQRPAPRQKPASEKQWGRTLIESRSREGWTPEARMGKTQRPIPAPPLAGMAGDVRKKARSLRISRKELRKAVIWYEVLGPPMSLRDPEREMWL